MSVREIDEALRRFGEAPDTEGSIVELAAVRRRHPAYEVLNRAMETLTERDRRGARLLVWTFVARTGLASMVRLHALCHVSRAKPVTRSTIGGLLAALLALDELLGDVDMPRNVREQEAAWEQWLAAIRSKAWVDGEGRTHRIDPAAVELRNLYVRELLSLGLSQRQAATAVGVSHTIIQRLVNGSPFPLSGLTAHDLEATERILFQHTPPEKRGRQ